MLCFCVFLFSVSYPVYVSPYRYLLVYSIDHSHRSNYKRNAKEKVWIAKWKGDRWGLGRSELITWNDPRSTRARLERHVDPNHIGQTHMGEDISMSADGSVIALSAKEHNGRDDLDESFGRKRYEGALHVLREVRMQPCVCFVRVRLLGFCSNVTAGRL